MIVKMSKYTFVVLASEKDEFLERLQELGMVDVTSIGWEPSEDERALMSLIERHRAAVNDLRARDESLPKGKPFRTGAEAFEKYEAAKREIATCEAEIARYEKLLAEAAPLGEVDPARIREIVAHGVDIGMLFEEAGLDVTQNITLPEESPAAMREAIERLGVECRSWDRVVADAAASVDKMEAEGESLADRLNLSRTKRSGSAAAEGSLVVMEAWARERQSGRVEEMLGEHPAVYYIKERPTPDDNTPVELKNSRFATPFEFIGDLYAKPRYGTMDLTRWFAPFFMLFFGMCMGDVGYGTMIFIGGTVLALRSPRGTMMRQIGELSMWCGGAAMVVGFLMGAVFGFPIVDWPVFAPIKQVFISSNLMFYLAVAIGIFQVMFAMVLSVVNTTRAFGLRHALATIGWLIVLVTCIATFGLQKLGVEGFAAGGTFAPGSIPFLAALGLGMVLLLFFNAPGKNVFVNFGGGLWALFNRVTGLLGDALSYIRLFAIGLSGGVLALVFNKIAFEMSPDVPVLGQVITGVILVFGHGLNLFLSTLSAIVHPLRLTFVEFFNNAGFEAGERSFNPLKKSGSRTGDLKSENNNF
jgi:V/A-type H+-transporting ATPase subunit I